MKKNGPVSTGFSLIELMVVVAIVSTAAAILLPHYLKQHLKSKQEVCHQVLREAHEKEAAYYQTHHYYAQALPELGWQPQGEGWYRFYFLQTPEAPGNYHFECEGNIDEDAKLDRAAIQADGKIEQIQNDLASPESSF